MRLYIQQGGETIQLSGKAQFVFDNCDVSTVETTVHIQPDYTALFNAVYSSPDQLKPISTINGVAPTDAGEFSIEGSECDSWDYYYYKNPDTKKETIGLQIVDLCPSCTTCENIYRLKYETENLRMWINTLKDVNLLLSTEPPYYSGTGPAMTVFKDNNNLSKLRVTGATNYWNGADGLHIDTEPNFEICMPGETPESDYMQLRGLELLKQYITTVHMWNYVVSQNNSSTEIQIAPEDTAGFVIQTKRSLPSCSGEQKIQCIIDVDLMKDEDGYPLVWKDSATSVSVLTSTYRLSVYVPTPTMEFKPFANSVANQCAPESSVDVGIDAIPSGTLQVTYEELGENAPRNTHKIIDTGVITANVAGTYVVRAKILPYIDMTLLNGAGETVDIRGATGSMAGVSGTTSTTGDITYSFVADHIETTKDNPTESDYLRSKSSPTRSVPFKLMWVIKVTWKILKKDGTADKQFEQTYNYKCNAVRTYYGVNMEPVTLSPLLPVAPEPAQGETT